MIDPVNFSYPGSTMIAIQVSIDLWVMLMKTKPKKGTVRVLLIFLASWGQVGDLSLTCNCNYWNADSFGRVFKGFCFLASGFNFKIKIKCYSMRKYPVAFEVFDHLFNETTHLLNACVFSSYYGLYFREEEEFLFLRIYFFFSLRGERKK